MISTLLTRIWVWVGGAIVAVTALMGAYLYVRNGGKASARAEAAVDVAKRTRLATQARIEGAKPVTKKEEADDVFNRDRS